MGLMDAKEYDPRPAQRRMKIIASLALIAVIVGIVWFLFRYWPEERVINRFFDAIERSDMQSAYGLYFNDPTWQQHPEKHDRYSFGQFQLDWGPSGEYGKVTSHHVECSTEPPKKGDVSPSGVIVVVRINNRAETKSMWVEKKSKTITESPQTVLCHGDH
ncbi:MAG TPA: hypothetical protein VHA33_12150 [Candidatus Angelobacter sp.]|jgi:hypothetical protein|nr:hypothetical protein [Candidatus Angelobacter sp.]